MTPLTIVVTLVSKRIYIYSRLVLFALILALKVILLSKISLL